MSLIQNTGRLRRLNQRFKSGDKYLSSAFNSVVLQSAAFRRGWERQHWPTGEHNHPRIPVAGGVVTVSGGAYSGVMTEGIEKIEVVALGEVIIYLTHPIESDLRCVPVVVPLAAAPAAIIHSVTAQSFHVRMSEDGPNKPWVGDFLVWVFGREAPRSRTAPDLIYPGDMKGLHPMPFILAPDDPLPAELVELAHGVTDRAVVALETSHVGEGIDAGEHDIANVPCAVLRFDIPSGEGQLRTSGAGTVRYAHGWASPPVWEYRPTPDEGNPFRYGYFIRGVLAVDGPWQAQVVCIADGWPSPPDEGWGTNARLEVDPAGGPRGVLIHLEMDMRDDFLFPLTPSSLHKIKSINLAVFALGGGATGSLSQGLHGEKGSPGEKGEKGEKGDQGQQGFKGDKGEKGDKGDIGERGPIGLKGEQGLKGIKGDQGIQGLMGDRGLPGLKGDTGERGPPGPSGAGAGISALYRWDGKTYYDLVSSDGDDGALLPVQLAPQAAGRVSLFLNGSIPDAGYRAMVTAAGDTGVYVSAVQKRSPEEIGLAFWDMVTNNYRNPSEFSISIQVTP